MNVITVSAICFERPDGAVLTVRKRDTHAFMLPGGKPEHGETPADCALREVNEELGVTLTHDEIEPLGTWEAPAANEAGWLVRATVFRTDAPIEPVAQAEIVEIRWIDPALGITDAAEAPLNRDEVFPLLLAERSA